MEHIVKSLTAYPMQGQVAASSSALSGFGPSDINSLFDVEFVSGGVYRYYSVIQSIFNGLQGTSSQGGYFNVNIRDVYEYELIE
ncbi:KTSC domain-containing protein [Teredinibacter turnerae]|uniref:KTSC domain-containing protein n=1 Tax=Teredinibacter turnerae TaxID=2426 RepID=UPI0009B77378